MTGKLDPLSPMTKKMRLFEIMDYLSNPNGVTEALGSRLRRLSRLGCRADAIRRLKYYYLYFIYFLLLMSYDFTKMYITCLTSFVFNSN